MQHTMHFLQVWIFEQIGYEPSQSRGFGILGVPILHRDAGSVYAAHSCYTAVPLLLMAPCVHHQTLREID